MSVVRFGLNARRCFFLLGIAVPIVSVGCMGTSGALAAVSGPGWSISSLAQPTSFVVGGAADMYEVTVTNVGDGPTEGAVTISDTLPRGVRLVSIGAHELARGEEFGCFPSGSAPRCVDETPVSAGDTLVVAIRVEVTSEAEAASVCGERLCVVNSATVAGGHALSVSTREPLTMPTPVERVAGEARESFGIATAGMEAGNDLGASDTQAGDHPYSFTTTLHTNTEIPNGGELARPVADLKDVVIDLPLGFVGDPFAAQRCTEAQLLVGGGTGCPLASRVGTVLYYDGSGVHATVSGTPAFHEVSALYNMVPEPGYPAQFGFTFFGIPVPVYASLGHTDSGYVLRTLVPGVPKATDEGVAVTLFGDPNIANGDSNSPQAFITNPDDCTVGPLTTTFEADSWSEPGVYKSAESTAYPAITGCNLLQFEPSIAMHPEVTQAEEPSGYEIDIKVPQNPNQFPVLATPDLKDVTMTLPAGMTISPGAGDGLVGCEATGMHGIDMPTNLPGGQQRTPTEVGEGEEIGPDGMSHLVAGHCPPASQIGTVQVTTPLLEKPLEGRVYVAQPQCGGPGQPGCTTADATDGRLFGLYLEAEGSGVVIKLAGSVSVNPTTGQLTARFTGNPQLPFSELSLHLKGGGRAPLANPRQCGPASANGDLAPWSAPVTPDANVSSAPFEVGWGTAGGACPAMLPFAPTLSAGSTSTGAGHFTPFTLTLSREDRQQDIARLQVHTPLGLLAMLSKVPLCEEPQAAQGTCSSASEVGTATVAAGSGSEPLWVLGHVFLTGPYGGGPFGLTVVVPAVAGPFNLGNVVVRSSISIDPATAAVTITTAPLPQILDGIPLRIQKLNVTVNRPEFIFNPTNCGAKQVAVTVEAEQGASANLTEPFAVEGCKSLPFKPTFAVSTRAKTSKMEGASLIVKVTSATGQANIAKVAVSLPKALPSRLTTIQHACPAAVFESNPAMCDPRSLVGRVTARTPVLPVVLSGPAYLVSHGGAAFPDLVVVLEGEGVRIDLVGNINIKGSITSSAFASIPDAPISSFELTLPQGSHSALTATLPAKAKGSLCGTSLVMPTTITGQNGALVKQSTKIAVSGCPKPRKKPKAKKASRAKHL
jgi:uncharacterized repeat protein (TIGR01451 family)